HGLTVPNEPIEQRMTGGICTPYGLGDFGKLSLPRQLAYLLSLVASARAVESQTRDLATAKTVLAFLAVAIDRVANYSATLCVWRTSRTCVLPTFSRQALQMVWDFGEMNPFAGSAGDWAESIEYVAAVIETLSEGQQAANVQRGTATSHSFTESAFDAVITDPPYYDNVDYAKLSDFFFVWLKRTIGHLYPDHFA